MKVEHKLFTYTEVVNKLELIWLDRQSDKFSEITPTTEDNIVDDMQNII